MIKNAVFSLIPAVGKSLATVQLRGELTLFNAEAIRLAFREAIAGPEPLHIDIAEVEAMDFAFVQLLLSVQYSARLAEKPLTWQLDLKEELNVLITRSGLKEQLYSI